MPPDSSTHVANRRTQDPSRKARPAAQRNTSYRPTQSICCNLRSPNGGTFISVKLLKLCKPRYNPMGRRLRGCWRAFFLLRAVAVTANTDLFVLERKGIRGAGRSSYGLFHFCRHPDTLGAVLKFKCREGIKTLKEFTSAARRPRLEFEGRFIT